MGANTKGSVGKGGKNDKADVETVQKLLNDHASSCGYSKLKLDGMCGKKTIAAISEFQTEGAGFKRGDGCVDPGKKTFKALGMKPGAVAKKGAGKVTGKTSGVKKELLEFLQAVADHYGTTLKVTRGKYDPTKDARDALESWGPKTWNSNDIKFLGIRKSDLKKWNDWYDKGVVKGESDARRDFISGIVELHYDLGYPDGLAVDLEKSTPKNIRAALKTGLEEIDHASRLHYNMLDGKPPKVTDKLKKKWKK
ncbi:MAG: hypothetical protein ACI89L_001657 [Phycisphaerales bacterium]|jgi:hypothetical protein